MTTPDPPDSGGTRQSGVLRDLRAFVILGLRRGRRLQDGLLQLLGSSVESRSVLVSRMLESGAHESTSYWLQLLVSIGIATLGLVLGSVAVIIGGMLVAPLMSPIIALAMGLATGSPFLVLRSATRIAMSVVVAIGGAAAITTLLPFHEVNPEIVARTSPTLLDLLTAGFCALAGVYAALRPGSDTASTAAGTSIGISLVPPLCTSGFGFGTGMLSVAGGAALLFLTNLVAIIFVGMVSFVAAGFNRVDAPALEQEELAKHERPLMTAVIAGRVAGLFGAQGKAGPFLRLLMPLALLAAVYVPLERALDEVAWQVRVRAVVRESLKEEPHEIVQSHVRVERHEVELLVVLVGTTAQAQAARGRLDARIREASGVAPHIEILAIPDATAYASLESTLRTSREPQPLPPPPPPPSPAEQLDAASKDLRSVVARSWPAASAGEPLEIEVGAAGSGPLRLRVVHLGAALGADGLESLSRSLAAQLEREVEIVDVAIPSEPITRAAGDLVLTSRLAAGLRDSAAIPALSVCVTQPGPPRRRRRVDPRDAELGAALRDLLSGHPRVTTQTGDGWSVRFVRGSCVPPVPSTAEPAAP